MFVVTNSIKNCYLYRTSEKERVFLLQQKEHEHKANNNPILPQLLF